MATVHLRPTSRVTGEHRRQQILTVATELFAGQGFNGTTTRHIAERAGVNEAIIFRHFPSKEDLYWAVIEQKCLEGQGQSIVRQRLAGGGSHQEIFAGIAQDFFRLRENDFTLGRLLLFSALENHRLSHRFFRTHIAELYEELAQYIRRQIAEGKFRKVDPLLAARSFWGVIVYHFLVQELFGGKRYQRLDSGQVSQALAEIWLKGMLPGRAEGQAENGTKAKRGLRKAEKDGP
ncbi:MAG: TetR/AcrR family transcriptional regulator [Terriglobales bacterium]